MPDLQEAITVLKNNNYKITKQRQELLNCLVQKSDYYIPLTQLDDHLRTIFPKMSHGTIYRNIKEMQQIGVVETKMFDNGLRVKFQCDFNNEQHSHFICKNCGKVCEVKLPQLDTSNPQLKSYRVDSYQLEILGICDKCLAKLSE